MKRSQQGHKKLRKTCKGFLGSPHDYPLLIHYLAQILDHWRGLFECPTTFLPFVTRQHAHLFCRHISVCSCLQTAQIHGCVGEKSCLGCEKYRESRYNHRVAAEAPIPKKKASVRILTRRTRKEIAKIANAITTIQSHRLIKSI